VYGACSPERGLILLCGVEDHVLDQSTPSPSVLSRQFPRYAEWQRLRHDVDRSLFIDTLKTLMMSGRHHQHQTPTAAAAVQLLQTTARCDVRLVATSLLLRGSYAFSAS